MSNPKEKKEMTLAEHKARHVILHKNLDELVADWLTCTEKLPSTSTVMELMQWAHKQTTNPTHAETKKPHRE